MTEASAVPGARPLQEWVNLFSDPAGPAYAALARIYGADRADLRRHADFVLPAPPPRRSSARRELGESSGRSARPACRAGVPDLHADWDRWTQALAARRAA